jgi:hypothetical protein
MMESSTSNYINVKYTGTVTILNGEHCIKHNNTTVICMHYSTTRCSLFRETFEMNQTTKLPQCLALKEIK